MKKRNLTSLAIDFGGGAPQIFIRGAEHMRTLIREEIFEWLEVTGAIPRGTSYYYELLGCVEDAGMEQFSPEEGASE